MSHFLEPLLREDPGKLVLVNQATGRVLASRVEPALDRSRRNRGLLGRDRLDAEHALVLAPCSAVHTWRMHFAIDIVFAARNGVVIRIADNVPARRIKFSLGAFATIEMRAGVLRCHGVRLGDRLELRPR